MKINKKISRLYCLEMKKNYYKKLNKYQNYNYHNKSENRLRKIIIQKNNKTIIISCILLL